MLALDTPWVNRADLSLAINPVLTGRSQSIYARIDRLCGRSPIYLYLVQVSRVPAVKQHPVFFVYVRILFGRGILNCNIFFYIATSYVVYDDYASYLTGRRCLWFVLLLLSPFVQKVQTLRRSGGLLVVSLTNHFADNQFADSTFS